MKTLNKPARMTINLTTKTQTPTRNHKINSTKIQNNKVNRAWLIFSLISSGLALTIEASSEHARPILISRPNETSIRVSWDRFANQRRLKSFSCGVEYFKVKLRFNDKTVQNWQVGSDLRSLQIDDPYLKKLKAVQVRALMCDGNTVYKSSWVKLNSSDHPTLRSSLQPPWTFNVVSIENNVLVRWQENIKNKHIEGYIVSYGEKVPDLMFKYVSLSHKNVTLENLKYSTLYVVGIRTFYKSLQSEALYKSIKTKDKSSFGQGTPKSEASSLPAPTFLRLKTLSSKAIELEWKDPSLYGDQRILDERFYVVHYNNMKSHQNTSIIVKALRVTIHNLQPDCWYVFKVRIGKGVLSSAYTDGIPGKTLKMDMKNRINHRKTDKDKRSKKYKKETKNERKIKRHQRNHRTYRHPFKSNLPYLHPTFHKPPLSLKKRQIINMKRKLHVNIGAFITWPRNLATLCPLPPTNASTNASSQTATPLRETGNIHLYTFRYKRSNDKSFTEFNLSDNFRYIQDLSPKHSYVYQVRYFYPYDQGWSQEEFLKLAK